MNSDYYRRQIQACNQAIAQLQADKSREASSIAEAQRKIIRANQAAQRSTNTTTKATKLKEAQRYQGIIVKAEKHIATIESRIAREQAKLNTASKNLRRAEEGEAKRRRLEEKKQMNTIKDTLGEHEVLHRKTMDTLERIRQLPEHVIVLFLAANPLDQIYLRLDEEFRGIKEMIRKSDFRDAVSLVSSWATRPLDVLEAINEHQPHIVHFSGHGSDTDEIVFQDDNGNATFVSKEAIVQVMKATGRDIQLVFFNTCYSQAQAQAVVQHIPVAVGMNTSIGDEAARVFAAQFYSAIGFGLSIRKAFDQAQAALMLQNIPEEDTPELFVAEGVDAEALILVRPPDVSL